MACEIASCDSCDCKSNRVTFQKELENLINKHSMENGSNTPDFILAKYLMGCLAVFDAAVTRRTLNQTLEPYEPKGNI